MSRNVEARKKMQLFCLPFDKGEQTDNKIIVVDGSVVTTNGSAKENNHHLPSANRTPITWCHLISS